LLSFFAGGMVPSGSNDPYALRRAASGVVNILADNKWDLDIDGILSDLIADINADAVKFGLPEEVMAELQNNVAAVVNFLTDRVVKALQDEGVRRDIINAVTKNNFADTTQMFESAQVLAAHVNDANFREGVEALTRVMRLTTKNATDATVDAALFENAAEKALFEAVAPVATVDGTDAKLVALLNLQPAVAAYFEETMVMVEDEAVKNNRLATLHAVADEATKVANFLELDVKSN